MIIYEEAHVEARRFFSLSSNDRLQNIIPLCPTCHTLFDLGYIGIHPEFRCFVFSKVRNHKNILRRFEYSYPHDNVVKQIPERHIKKHLQEQFEYKYGENELFHRFKTQPAPRWLHYSYIEKY